MKHRFFQSRAWLIIQTVVAAALIYALGFEMGGSDLSDQLDRTRRDLAEQVDRNVQLIQERNDLERRLQKALKLPVPRTSEPDRPAPAPNADNEEAAGLLRMNKAEVLLGGKLILTLEEIGGRPRRAVISFRAGGREGRKALAAGQQISLKVNGRRHRLLVKQITTGSVRYSLSRAE